MAEDTSRYGEQPLAQTVAAAGALRRLTGLLLSLEHEHPTVEAMLAQIADWERELAPAVPPDPSGQPSPTSASTATATNKSVR